MHFELMGGRFQDGVCEPEGENSEIVGLGSPWVRDS